MMWPANSWIFWLLIAGAFVLYLRFGFYSRQGAPRSPRRLLVLGVVAAAAVAATALLPAFVFASLTGAGFSGDAIDLALWSTGIALFAVAILVACWALFADRSRGRRRCPKCWYDMTGAPTLTCPECGHAAAAERRLYKTRRRWRLLPLALFPLIAGAGAMMAPIARSNEWPSALPDAVILAGMPFGSRSGLINAQLTLRVGGGQLSNRMVERGPTGIVARWSVRRVLRDHNSPMLDRALELVARSRDPAPFHDELAALVRAGDNGAIEIMLHYNPGDPSMLEAGQRLLGDTDPSSRRFGAIILTRHYGVGESSLSAGVQALLDSSLPEVRSGVMSSCMSVPFTPVVSALADRGIADGEVRVRQAALRLLSFSAPDDPRIEPTLLDWLAGNDAKIRNAAVWHIVYFGPCTGAIAAAMPDAILDALNQAEQDNVFDSLVGGPALPHAAEILAGCAQYARLRPAIITASATLASVAGRGDPGAPPLAGALASMRSLEAAWRAEGDTTSADAMLAVIHKTEELAADAQPDSP